jgi:hypothetical protein
MIARKEATCRYFVVSALARSASVAAASSAFPRITTP